jgi:hypothetical protein
MPRSYASQRGSQSDFFFDRAKDLTISNIFDIANKWFRHDIKKATALNPLLLPSTSASTWQAFACGSVAQLVVIGRRLSRLN